MFLIPKISYARHSFKMEDTVLVTLTFKWKRNDLPESGNIYIRDLVPSGFKPLRLKWNEKKLANRIDYIQNEDVVEFKVDVNEMSETVKISYLMIASIPGKYLAVEPFLSIDDLLYSSEKEPLRERKTVKIGY